MPQTSDTCQTSGIYQSGCKDREQIALSKGERFPPCGTCKQSVNWTLVKATQNPGR